MSTKTEETFELLGLTFRNIYGLKCGLDKYGTRFNLPAYSHLGFIETGPCFPSDTNSGKGLFKKPNDVKSIIRRIQGRHSKPLIFANLCHNPSSQDEESLISDYTRVFSLMYDFADAFCINASYTSSSQARPFHDITLLSSILEHLLSLRLCYEKYKPIIVKVSPVISRQLLDEIISYCRISGVDAICVLEGAGTGETVSYISETTERRFPIIAECSACEEDECLRLAECGASLIEVGYSIYGCKRFIKRSNK